MNMKNLYRYVISALLVALMVVPQTDAYAGNKDRTGQAGASELLINPWARSSGWGGVNIASVRGHEAIFVNVAGTAFAVGTEVAFSQSVYLEGTGTNISAFGLSQQLGESGGVFSLSVTSMSYGDAIDKTTWENPEGNIGTFSPNNMVINVAYGYAFSASIYGGLNVKIINESISDVSAGGIGIDAGIMYVAGDKENIKFGITLKNVGPTLTFSGDGLTERVSVTGQESEFSMNQRVAQFDLPTSLQIGVDYDILFDDDQSRVSIAAAFYSLAFGQDQFKGGAEFSWRDMFMVRAGYTYENGMFEAVDSGLNYTAEKGPSVGATFRIPFNKETGSGFSIDYAYRATQNFGGTHTFGAILNL